LGVTLSETRPQELTLNFHQLPVHIRRNSNQVLELLFSIHQEAIQQILRLDKPTIRQDLDNRKTSDRHQVSDHRQLLSEFQIKRTPPACSENRLLLSPPPAMHHPLSVSTHRRFPIPSVKMKHKNPFLNPCSGPQLRNFNPLSVPTGVFGQTNTPVRNTTTNPFQKPAQTTTGFNTEQPGFSFNQTQASNLTQVCNLNSFEVDASTSTISTIGVGQSTLTFGVTNQRNTSILFNEPPPIVKFASLKKELKNKKIVTEKLSNKSNIMSKSKERESDAVNSLKMVEKLANEIEELITKVGKKQRNEVEELLIKIEEAKRECKLKEEVHRVLTDNWNVERDNFNTQIKKLNKKILTLEMTNGSKEKLIQRLNENLKKDRESVSKANFNIGELRVQIWKEILSKNNGNLGYDANTGTNVLAKSVMEKETIEK
jgi:uncharacterized coiled-coil protein SlyX